MRVRTLRWRLTICLVLPSVAAAQERTADQPPAADGATVEERNKALARRFYEDVWFSPNTSSVDELVANEYIVHDIGDIKGVREAASAQKDIADFFWESGTMDGSIDYQLADGDLVATRWQWRFEPEAWWMRLLMAGHRDSVPVINVFRFEEGKIVEIWNHRHDIDVAFRVNMLRAQGFTGGLLLALLGIGVRAIWRRYRQRDPLMSPARGH